MDSSKAHDHLIINDYIVPIYLNKEFRNSIRFSITKKGLIIRCPVFSNATKMTENAKAWGVKTLRQKPGAFVDFKWVDYSHEKNISLLGKSYMLQVETIPTAKDSIFWNKDRILIRISNQYSKYLRSKIIKKLIASFAAKRFLPDIIKIVEHLNDKHFGVKIGKVRLKNNRSNWGSCSSKGNINLSVRLLKAPYEILEYVIIHELAHRIEMNHSSRFWQIVGNACPDYKDKEKWLKDNSHKCIL